uniref:Uncharacterized protein n=1 Tax=Rhizophora mucronata TaxID=61149 RepID=A0A2P2K3M2_RHIMU
MPNDPKPSEMSKYSNYNDKRNDNAQHQEEEEEEEAEEEEEEESLLFAKRLTSRDATSRAEAALF